MSSANHSFFKLSTIALALAMTFASGISIGAQTAVVGNVQITGLPDDWTHHHIVFSDPGTEEDAIRQGKHDQWLKIVNDPRYVIQQLRRRSTARGPAADDIARIRQAAQANAAAGPQVLATDDSTLDPFASEASKAKKTKITKDWSVSLGSGNAAAAGTFTGAPTASNTVQIVNGSTNTLTLTATATGLTMGSITADNYGSSIAGDTVTLGTVVYNLESTQASCTGTYDVCVYYGTSTSTAAAALDAAINNDTTKCPTPSGSWGSTCYTVVTSGAAPNPGASATVSSAVVTITNLTYTTLPLSYTKSSGTDFTLSPSSGGITQVASCSSRTTGKLIIDANSTTQQATNLAGAISSCDSSYSSYIGATATSSGAVVTVTATTAGTSGNSIGIPDALSNFAWNGSPEPTTLSGGGTATVQPNAYPAKYGASLTGASCNDYIIYPTGQAGGSGSANIIAYNNLYAGTGTGTCTPTNPTVYWAYNTANGYTVTTSPIISLDGTQVAFIESNGTSASLVLIKWAAETGETMGAPLNLTNQGSGFAYNSCTPTAAAPCMYTIPFLNALDDSFSAPFCDYRGDAIYVGDDGGYLHQFTGVFLGAPAENTATTPWPVKLGNNPLASPVYDATYDAVFVGDLGINGVGGLYCVTSSSGSCTGSGHTSLSGGTWWTSSTTFSGGQIADAPLINSGANYLLAFVNSSGSPGADTVYGHSEQYFPSTYPGSVAVGTGATGYYLYAGAFDNAYYDSPNNTGEMFVVGNTGATTGATLYRVNLSYGFLQSVASAVTGLTEDASGAYPWPSPVTEFCNNGTSACTLQTVSGCTVSTTSTTLTCSSGGFTSADVGATIVGTDIPTEPNEAGATITAYTSSKVVTISAVGTGNTMTGTATIGVTNAGKDYVFFSVNRADVGSCTVTATHGCILSYNVSNPSSVAIAGTGLPVTTPGTNGCWATGGLSIDNSATTTGASQIYFVNLNGATAGSSGNGPASSSCTVGGSPTIDATQASQAGPG